MNVQNITGGTPGIYACGDSNGVAEPGTKGETTALREVVVHTHNFFRRLLATSSVILPTNYNDDVRIPGPQIKQGLRGLDKVLGRSIVDLLIYDLERQGINLGQDEYYTIYQLKQVFEATFGEDGASLLVKKLRKELE